MNAMTREIREMREMRHRRQAWTTGRDRGSAGATTTTQDGY